MICAAAAGLAAGPGHAAVPEENSLSPWVVLPAPAPAASAHIAMGGYVSFPQPAVPAQVVALNTSVAIDGIAIPAGTKLALAVSAKGGGKAWCVLPAGTAAHAPKSIERAWGGA